MHASPPTQTWLASQDSVARTEFGPALALLHQVSRSYQMDEVRVPVIRQMDLLIRPACFTVVIGPSGSGKTTLLNMIGGIDRPDAGQVLVAGTDLATLDDDRLADFRSRNIGFVFQNFNLLPVLTAYENVEYPLVCAGVPPGRRGQRVDRLLAAVGLKDQARHLPGQLSGGQRQRVALARALARKPKVVIADEPTANLDSRTGQAVLQLMRYMQTRYRISFIFSSHDPNLIESADDVIIIRDGQVRSIARKDNARTAADGASHRIP